MLCLDLMCVNICISRLTALFFSFQTIKQVKNPMAPKPYLDQNITERGGIFSLGPVSNHPECSILQWQVLHGLELTAYCIGSISLHLDHSCPSLSPLCSASHNRTSQNSQPLYENRKKKSERRETRGKRK